MADDAELLRRIDARYRAALAQDGARIRRLEAVAERARLRLLPTSKGWALYDPVADLVTGPPWLPRERSDAMTLDEVERALGELPPPSFARPGVN